MRTIKFRGKAIPCNEWVYGSYVKMENETKTIQRHAIMDVADTDNKFIKSGKDYQMSLSVVEKNTIGQFTGLKDSIGREIYEGDIIRSFDSKGEPIIHYIIYDDEEAGFVAVLKGSAKGDFGYGKCCQKWITMCEKEVIGNIYDNPELLKEK